MAEAIERLEAIGVVPVVEIEDAEAAVELADALVAGGIGAAELTFRTPAAVDAVRAIAEHRAGFLVGAGTVLSAEAAVAAIDAGAAFLVSPGLAEPVAAAAAGRGVPYVPGAATATEVQRCLELGLSLVKFFPAEPLGGVSTLAALAAPYGPWGVRFMPTGGISAATAPAYLAQPTVACVGGSWVATRAALAERDFARIRGLAEEAAAIVAGVRGGEVAR